jgi:hypothetical protein
VQLNARVSRGQTGWTGFEIQFHKSFVSMFYLSAEVSAAAGVQGLMSLIFWTITLVVVFK